MGIILEYERRPYINDSQPCHHYHLSQLPFAIVKAHFLPSLSIIGLLIFFPTSMGLSTYGKTLGKLLLKKIKGMVRRAKRFYYKFTRVPKRWFT